MKHQDFIADEDEIVQTMAKYKFYHIIKVTDKLTTPGWPEAVPAQDLCLKHLESLDLKGKDVLDIGCRDGLFSFKAESMGAAKVIGIDNDLSEPATKFLIPFFNSKVQMRQLNLYDLKPDTFGLFDVVIFPGVLYHLRYPFWAFKTIRDVVKVGGHLLIETAIWYGEPGKAVLFCPMVNEGPYGDDGTSCTFFNEKGLVDTMKSLGFETVGIEYLNEYLNKSTDDGVGTRPIKGLSQKNIKQMMKNLAKKKGFVKSDLHTDRCVFHLIYRGYDQNAFTMKYWETTHDFHTKHEQGWWNTPV